MGKLAIKGHKTSGRFVISLLKMMGGKDNIIPCVGTGDFYYFIDSDGIIKHQTKWNKEDAGFKQYTYGEFVENFPYKIGDKVCYFIYDVAAKSSVEETSVVMGMKWHKDTVIYTLDNGDTLTANNLSPVAEQPSVDKAKAPSLEGQDYSEGRCGYRIPEWFELEKVEDGEIILKPKKKLPKTWEQCSRLLDGKKKKEIVCLTGALNRLLIARNAYWKSADNWSFKIGENSQDVVYAISVFGSGIMKDFYYALNCNRILVFPTEEMRDTFYENFKDLINECKELL